MSFRMAAQVDDHHDKGCPHDHVRPAFAVEPAPHVVIFPYDEHGHVTPAFAVGRALARRGLRVTGVLTATRYATVSPSSTQIGLFCIVPLPESPPPGFTKEDDVCYQQSLQKLEPGFEELMLQLQPQASCLISDIMYPWSQDIADTLGIPRFHFWPLPAIVPLVLTYTPALCERGLLPFQTGMDDELVDCIPGLPKPFRLGDIPIDFRSRDQKQMEFMFWVLKGMNRATGALLNTVYELEAEIVDALSAESDFEVYTLGSMSSLESADTIGGVTRLPNAGDPVDDECLEWLDKQPLASVVYVALGSIVGFTEEEVSEMAQGLEASGQPFLWVLRRPRDSNTDPMSELPDGFLDRTRERGRVIGWAPQTAVLAHPSVGCFLTHCGMGSLLEAMSEGVPLIGGFCKISDQNTVLRLASQEWGTAIPLLPASGITPSLSSCVASCVKEVCHGEKGRALRSNALKLKATLANALASPHGSSFLCLSKLTQAIVRASSCEATVQS